jgi:hypothetical protein
LLKNRDEERRSKKKNGCWPNESFRENPGAANFFSTICRLVNGAGPVRKKVGFLCCLDRPDFAESPEIRLDWAAAPTSRLAAPFKKF